MSFWAALAFAAEPPTAKVIKVLPQFLDLEGRASTQPSLYSRDAYQAMLRTHPKQRSGLRFVVQWKAKNIDKLNLRVEMRGLRTNQATTATLEMPVKRKHWFNTWSELALTGEKYAAFGEMSAWRVTLLNGKEELAEQKSFLW